MQESVKDPWCRWYSKENLASQSMILQKFLWWHVDYCQILLLGSSSNTCWYNFLTSSVVNAFAPTFKSFGVTARPTSYAWALKLCNMPRVSQKLEHVGSKWISYAICVTIASQFTLTFLTNFCRIDLAPSFWLPLMVMSPVDCHNTHLHLAMHMLPNVLRNFPE